eukprot:g44964.t1
MDCTVFSLGSRAFEAPPSLIVMWVLEKILEKRSLERQTMQDEDQLRKLENQVALQCPKMIGSSRQTVDDGATGKSQRPAKTFHGDTNDHQYILPITRPAHPYPEVLLNSVENFSERLSELCRAVTRNSIVGPQADAAGSSRGQLNEKCNLWCHWQHGVTGVANAGLVRKFIWNLSGGLH